MSYPIFLKVSANLLSTWGDDEYASWEDHDRPTEGHVYNLIERHHAQLELRDEQEARQVLESGRHWSHSQGWDKEDGRTVYRQALAKVCDRIDVATGLSTTPKPLTFPL